jgi:hypothetical protein
VPAGTFLLPKSPALPAWSCRQKGYCFGKVVSPGTPRAYLQKLLSRQKLLSLWGVKNLFVRERRDKPAHCRG